MSETNTTKQKNFKLIKTTANDLIFYLSPVSNSSSKKLIHLTSRMPQISLPTDWALGIFLDDNLFKMYEDGLFTFDDNEGIAKVAYEEGFYFSDTFSFEPAPIDRTNEILEILKSGNRQNIMDAMNKYGKLEVSRVAADHTSDLTTAVVRLLENSLGIQLLVDGE